MNIRFVTFFSVKYRCDFFSDYFFFLDKLENAKHQLDALRKYLFTPDFPDVNQIQEILREHYDSTCDYCTTKLPPSLEQIQGHYNRQHAKKGYLKCCNRKLETINHVNEHVIFHLYPDYYRQFIFCLYRIALEILNWII